jgi:hypothetical protein
MTEPPSFGDRDPIWNPIIHRKYARPTARCFTKQLLMNPVRNLMFIGDQLSMPAKSSDPWQFGMGHGATPPRPRELAQRLLRTRWTGPYWGRQFGSRHSCHDRAKIQKQLRKKPDHARRRDALIRYGSSPAQRAVLRMCVSISTRAAAGSLERRAAMMRRCSAIDALMRAGSVIGIGWRCVSVNCSRTVW